MAGFSEMARKKVLGVPVLYWAGAFVAVLALVAWKIKPAAAPEDTTPADNGGTDQSDPSIGDYSGLGTNGTVVVQQTPTNPADTPDVVKTNEDWVREGAQWLTYSHSVPGSAAAAALSHYVGGVDRTFQEQEWVDMVIKEKGQPPDSIAEGGSVGSAPAQKQFTNFPGTHTIKGGSDNGFSQLATLYYGSAADDRVDLIQAANTSLGASGPWAVGTRVNIPAYHAPVYYTITAAKGMTASQVASKNGITLAQLAALNDPRGGAYQPTYWLKPHTSVRVK